MGERRRTRDRSVEGSTETSLLTSVSISAPLEVPEDHPILYANRVNVTGSDSEVFLDFFLVDAHTGPGGGLTGKLHFVTRIVLADPAAKSLFDFLQPVVKLVESRRGG